MKVFYFLIIILIIYFITTHINVVHIETLSPVEQKELNKKSKYKSRLTDTYVKADLQEEIPNKQINQENTTIENFTTNTTAQSRLFENERIYSGSQYNSRNYKKDYYDLTPDNVRPKLELPNMNDLFILIRSEYIDNTYTTDKYKFNSSNLPVTNRYPNKNTVILDKKYTSAIKMDIMSWNDLFSMYYDLDKKLISVKDIKLIFIMETEYEFIIQAIVKLSYRNKAMYFQVKYYGIINKTDDILNGLPDTDYELKLIELKPVAGSEFSSQPNPMNQDASGPFMSMDSQMDYVNKINKMHREETNMYI